MSARVRLPARVALIGFGDVGGMLGAELGELAWAYDRKTYIGPERRNKLADYRRLGVHGRPSNKAAVEGAAVVLCAVSPDKALAAARESARHIAPRSIYYDLNTVKPEQKRLAARSIEAAGAYYVDVAIMVPVRARQRATPLLLSGIAASRAARVLAALGFTDVHAISTQAGVAAALGMIAAALGAGGYASSVRRPRTAPISNMRNDAIGELAADWPGINWSRLMDRYLGHVTDR